MTVSETTRPRLRELTPGEMLDVAFRICVAHWRTLLKAVLVVIVPVQIISTLVTADYTLSSFDVAANSDATTRETMDELNRHVDELLVSALLQVLALVFATAACLRAIVSVYLGDAPDWRGSLTYAARRAGPLVAVTALYLGGVTIGAIALLLPGIWLYVAWAFALPVLLVEGLRGPAALGRSQSLVRGRWWRTFSVIALGFLLAIVISTVARGVFLLGVLGADDDVLVLVLSTIAGIVGLALTAPFQAALLTVLYLDTRVRAERLDLERLAGEIGAGDPAAPGAAAPPPAAVAGPAAGGSTGAPLWPSPPPAGQAERPRSRGRTASGGPPPPPGWRPAPAPSPAPGGDDEGESPERAPG